ncbi:ATP-binding protein [Pseudomonas sp. FME51]|uniref:ATP-binding protein n=1 Tax=Pseudomonas sp. FME51 TaxID=2742609 RepID=UPI00299F8DBB|nr:DUF499 domain-containing protein [Pseudomonas sp. FME51]
MEDEHDGAFKAVCRRFAEFYKENAGKFPLETQASGYYDRLCSSYPIHPEIFDRLYEDWSTLDKFQRTRGVLQYMAIVIYRLWNSDNRDALIMPGSIDLDDGNVRNKSIHYLPQGWEPVIEREGDGPRSEPHEIDSRDTRFGSVQAARRSMRTIFLGSAPSGTGQVVKGVQVERILLGAVQPGQTIGVFEDVLKRLRDRLHYLYSEQDRFWLETKPNLRREMESRLQNISTREQLIPLLRDKVRSMFASNHSYAGIHVFAQSGDIPDEYGPGPRLVVLPPNAAYSRADGKAAFTAVEEILTKRGEQPRQKRNRLIFFAADYDVVNRLKEAGRVLIAWQGIVVDIDEGNLNLDLFQAKQAKKNRDGAELTLKQVMRDCYKWLLCPSEDFVSGKPELHWEAVTVSSAATSLVSEIENKLKEEEWLVTDWSPIHLKNLVEKWYFRDGRVDVSALKVFQDCCHYLYMPRLLNDNVFKAALNSGVASADFFGFAAGKDGDKYLGFTFDRNTMVTLDADALLIQRDAAEAYREASKPPTPPAELAATEEGGGYTVISPRPPAASIGAPTPADSPPKAAVKKQFYGTIDIDPVKVKMDFAQIYDEIIEQFTSRVGVDMRISVEIQANSKTGFDEALQRTVKENCNVLKFSGAEFEEE